MSKLRNQHWYNTINYTNRCICNPSVSPQPPLMPLFHARIPNCIKSSHPLNLLWPGTVFQSFLIFFMTIIFLKNTGEVPHRMSLSLGLSWDSLQLNWSYKFWGKLHWGEMSMPLYHFKGSWYHHDLSLVILTLVTWLTLLHYKISIFHIPSSLLRKQVLSTANSQEEGN